MTIGNRLITLFIVALVAMFIIGGVGVSAFKSMDLKVLYMTGTTQPSVKAITDLALNYRDMRSLLLSHIMEQDADIKKVFADSIVKTTDKAKKALETYSRLISSDADKANFKQVDTAFSSYLKNYTDALAASNAGKADDAVTALYSNVMPAEQGMQKAIEKATSDNQTQQERAAAEIDSVYHRVVDVFVIVIAASIVTLSVVGYFIYRAITGPLASMEKTVDRIGRELDFTTRVPVQSSDEVGKTVMAFNRLLDTVQASFKDISIAASGVATQATEMAGAARRMSTSSNSASESAANMAATVEEVTVSINHVANRTNEANKEARRSGEIAGAGESVISETITEINGIAGRVDQASQEIDNLARESAKVGAVVNVIKDVADQTNLLALNAAIEAARAGEQGRGFAVVADEVRKLADRTSQATKEIGTLIAASQLGADSAVTRMKEVVDGVEAGVRKAGEAGNAITRIREGSGKLANMVDDITLAINEQSNASTHIAQQVELIAQMSEETSTVAAMTAKSAEQLHGLAGQMQAAVARYRV